MKPIDEHQQGVCPNCQESDLEYGVLEVVDDQVMYPWTCSSCGTTGEEWYTMSFTNHERVEVPELGD